MVRSLKSKGRNTIKNTFSVLSNKSKRNQRGFLKKILEKSLEAKS